MGVDVLSTDSGVVMMMSVVIVVVGAIVIPEDYLVQNLKCEQ